MQKELTIVFKDGGCKVHHVDKGFIMSTKISSKIMFGVSSPIVLPMSMKISYDNVTHLCHCKYGHLSFKGFDRLIMNEMMKGIPSLKDLKGTCLDCLIGKKHREAIPNQATWRAKEIF